MPELPDVETFRRYLSATSLRQEIVAVSGIDERILRDVSPRTLRRWLVGASFESAVRHGKYLFAELSRTGHVVMHFGMTGFLRHLSGAGDRPAEHARMRIQFRGGAELDYHCQRLFGSVGVTRDIARFIEEHDLGPDALSVASGDYAELLLGKRVPVKSALMDQRLLAGIGNVYSDEILFQARLDPRTRTVDLDDRHLAALYESTQSVLRRAIDVKADPARMPKSWITPRRGRNETCPRCGGRLERQPISQRNAYFCPRCQERP